MSFTPRQLGIASKPMGPTSGMAGRRGMGAAVVFTSDQLQAAIDKGAPEPGPGTPYNGRAWFPPDDLSTALSDFAQLGPAWAPTGGGSMMNLVDSVASNPDYQGSIKSSTTSYLPWVLAGSALLLLLVAASGRR